MSIFVKSFDAALLSKEYVKYVRGDVDALGWSASEHLRFGQYIVNKYLKAGMVCPSIFYEESDPLAFEKIYRELNRG